MVLTLCYMDRIGIRRARAAPVLDDIVLLKLERAILTRAAELAPRLARAAERAGLPVLALS